jgi:predicted HTH domain antitoxin
VRKLLAEGLEEWRKQQALEEFEAGEVSLLRAADLAGVSVWAFARLCRSGDVTWVDEEGLASDLDEL